MSKDRALRQTLLSLLICCAAFVAVLALPGSVAAQVKPTPTPWKPPILIEPTPTPDPQKDQGLDEPSIGDSLLQEETPTEDPAKQPTTDTDKAFVSLDYKETHSEVEGGGHISPEPNAIPYDYTAPTAAPYPCERMVKASVVAFDQVFFWNRLGAVHPQGMIYALRHNVVPIDWRRGLVPGNVRLRGDKRPRPLALRMNVGDCLQIDFQNLLNPDPVDDEQPITRHASIHVVGLQAVNDIKDDGSNVGRNPSPPGGIVPPGGRITYTLYADGNAKEGNHLMYSTAATTTGEGDGGQIPPGLFGAVNVEPRGAEWYRSQITHNDLRLATVGYTPAPFNQPIIDYNAKYPWWHRYRGLPILKILNRRNIIVHQDLNAIITGPGLGVFDPAIFPSSPTALNRHWPFREFTIIYHDEIGAVQAFPQFEDGHPDNLEFTLHGSRDGFAINYGTGGIGAEILANRLGVGPMKDCQECLFEEFFLTAWAVGDPAMVVDRPANAPCDPDSIKKGRCSGTDQNPIYDVPPGFKAMKAFYPADPSNVHHSYIGDHTKMRILHAGPKEHHIHHLHAHQWLKSADSDVSSYNDSQALGPGSGMSLEITHGGSGNRNLTVGDSIFHCHFYPHFAQGMWELWRSHDVFEEGTRLDYWGVPAHGSRALPDAEILRGTPIPAIVPLPGGAKENMAKYVMPPMPEAKAEIVNGQIRVTGNGNPGFPFFSPARAGHRPPHPPLDTEFTAGLPRHIILNADVVEEHHTRTNFDKEIANITAQEIREDGEKYEKFAMLYHEQPTHQSFMTDGTPGLFMTNGLPRQPGAPFADPCVSDRWDKEGNPIFPVTPVGEPRTYKGVMFQFDMEINKKGWHFPQSRIESLWEDWERTIERRRAPEPLFFRANSRDCVTFHHANLIPKVYVQDDFQVRTPTDIVGQHIHLVKFDVTSSDGAGNGWNYEDGTFGPQEVEHRIDEINAVGGIFVPVDETSPQSTDVQRKLKIEDHPFFKKPTQVTFQRWFVDPTQDRDGNDRTLRTVFTHDHFGPSTHQQTGLYAGLVIEPEGSVWRENEAPGNLLGGAGITIRDDGGPTSFAAVIIPPERGLSYREFMLEYQDYHLAYEAGGGGTADDPHPDPELAINPPGKNEIPLPRMIMGGPPFGPETALYKPPVDARCPDGEPAPCPEIVSAADPGTFSVNYRNEPIALRVRDPRTNTQAAGDQGDLSLAYASIPRADEDLNREGPYPPLVPGMGIYDPFTPLLRANENDRVQVRILVGAHEEGHNFTIHGVKWLFEPSDPDSGWRNSQMTGISEKFDFILAGRPPVGPPGNEFRADYLYKPGASVDDQWNGMWGLMRVYRPRFAGRGNETNMPGMPQNDVPPFELPNNPSSSATTETSGAEQAGTAGDETIRPDFIGPCPRGARPQHYNVAAYLARDILPERRLNFDGQNGYTFTVKNNTDNLDDPTRGDTETGPLNDPTAILFVDQDNDIDPETRMYKRSRVEPLLLRANAGDCITVTLTNNLPEKPVDLAGYNAMPMIVDYFNANQVVPSRRVGLHPQLVHYDVTTSDGMNVGLNPIQTVGPGDPPITYTWYAGDVGVELTTNRLRGKPVEFGATNLVSSDPIKHSNKSAIGALIIEPFNSSWAPDEDSTHSAMIYLPVDPQQDHCAGCPIPVEGFREFVLQFQNDLNMRFGSGRPVPNLAEEEDPEDTGQKAINYRTEPLWTRLCYWPALILTGNEPPIPAHQCPESDAKQTRALDMTNSLHNSQIGGRDPVTPIFTADTGQNVRFRVLHPGGHARNNVFMVHGHDWQEMPYQDGSNSTVIGFKQDSPWHGAQWGHGPSNHFDVLIQSAGGTAQVPGDYLYRTFQSFQFDGGIWGLFRVERRVVDPPCCDEIYYY